MHRCPCNGGVNAKQALAEMGYLVVDTSYRQGQCGGTVLRALLRALADGTGLRTCRAMVRRCL